MTAETKRTHTPGPWEAFYVGGAGWSVRKQHERPGYTGLAPICSMAWWQFDIPGIIDNGISEANARLIAAAPDLLATLKDIVTYVHPGDDVPLATMIEDAKAAIALAEGKGE